MKNHLVDFYRSGNNINALFYLRSALRMLVPRPIAIAGRKRILAGWEDRPDADEIAERVDFYCLPEAFGHPYPLGSEAKHPSEIKISDWPSTYYYDAMRWLRRFPDSIRVNLIGGDVWENPQRPALIKARRLDALRPNGVLLNLDSIRHFNHPHDPVPFLRKRPVALFRGACAGKPRRLAMLERWAGQPLCDLGATDPQAGERFLKPKMSVAEHFGSQFIIAPEGNDVASALQWIMASECVPVMPRPTVESWLMHSAMQPGRHYIEVADDYSDLAERIEYYASHQREAAEISEESKAWARRFAAPRREAIVSLLVVERYLRLTGQL